MHSKQHTLRLIDGAMLWNITPHKSYMMQQANQPTNQPSNHLKNCMEQSPWANDSFSASQHTFITMFTTAHLLSLTWVINAVHLLPSYLFKNHINIILPSMPVSRAHTF